MRTVAVIPARYGSTRFPGKPLAPILGRPMIRWVWERASRARGLDRLVVATDDERIAREVRGFGGEAVMTPADCPTGSDRVQAAVCEMECDVVLNLQGDEPTLDHSALEALLALMSRDPSLLMGTLVAPVRSREEFDNPNVVKAALGEEGRCLYFSRSPVPFCREVAFGLAPLWRHVGIYALRKEFLAAFTSWPRGTLERTESLEQLRALERGVVIRAARVQWPGCAVDSPEDIQAAEAFLRAANPDD